MVLSKVDFAIASRYADLVPDAATRTTVFNALQVRVARSGVAAARACARGVVLLSADH
jgi:phosphoenolpyruvate carboxylase